MKKERKCLKKKTSSNDFLIGFRLAAINNRLSMEISKDEKEELEAEYDRLIELKNK
jgi:hypothetical protein